MDRNTSHLAGEFLVAGELARRQLAVSMTFGNAKSVDIYAESASHTYRVDAKAIRSKTNWPMARSQINGEVVYVFVYLGTQRAVLQNRSAEFFIVKGSEILSKNLISTWSGNRSGVTYQTLKASGFEDAWSAFK